MVDIEDVRKRSEWFLDSLSGEGSIGGYGLAAAAIESAEDVPALLVEVERLTRWKADAMTVLSGWEAVWEALDMPGALGQQKSDATRAGIDDLRRERDEYKRQAEVHDKAATRHLFRADEAEADRDRWKTAYEMAEPILTEHDRLWAAVEAVKALAPAYRDSPFLYRSEVRDALDEHLKEG